MRVPSLIFLTALASGGGWVRAEERNAWPFFVEQVRLGAEGSASSTWSGAGPFVFSQPLAPGRFGEAERARGIRPLALQAVDSSGRTVESSFLYPLFTYRGTPESERWSVFSIVNHSSTQGSAGRAPNRSFDLWPFYYSRDTGNPETSYHALFPLFGRVHNRFGQDRLTWVGFPLYARWEKNQVSTYTAPWPFVKVLRGEGNRGFELWPLFGRREKAGAYREQFYLWPLLYKAENRLWEDQPDVKQGFLPFYAQTRSAEVRSDSYLLFFGSSDRIAPYRYHQTNYFWPIWVQGRGDDRYVNRWGPFYSHSRLKGVEKRWVLWPVWREQTWTDAGLRESKRQVLYFLYRDHVQRSASNPQLAAARKAHLWPLVSVWDNGAGRRQVQALSPLEVFFPNNEQVRLLYTPFFALYRYNRTAPGSTEHSLLWNLVTMRRTPEEREFHLGPLFSSEASAGGRRYELGNGVIAWEKDAGEGWNLSVFDFKRRRSPRSDRTTAP